MTGSITASPAALKPGKKIHFGNYNNVSIKSIIIEPSKVMS